MDYLILLGALALTVYCMPSYRIISRLCIAVIGGLAILIMWLAGFDPLHLFVFHAAIPNAPAAKLTVAPATLPQVSSESSIILILGALVGVFAMGTFWFWALCVIAWFAIGFLQHEEEGFWATVVVIATLLILQFLGDVKVFNFVWHHPIYTVLFVLAYVFAGTVWSFAKWTLHNLKEKERRDDYGGFQLPKRGDDWTDERYEAEIKNALDRIKPKPREHKAEIVRWMMFWPWSIIWTLLDDIVYRAFRYIFELFQHVYEHITDWVYRDEIKKVEEALAKNKKTQGDSGRHD